MAASPGGWAGPGPPGAETLALATATGSTNIRSMTDFEDDDDFSPEGGVFEGMEELRSVNKEKEERKARLLEWYREEEMKNREIATIAGKNMLQITVCNQKVGVRGTVLPLMLSSSSVIQSLENRGLDLNKVHSLTFTNMTTVVNNNSIKYVTMKQNDYCIEKILGEYTVVNHTISVSRANSKAVMITFMKVPSFVLDAELVHFASFYGKVLNERGVISQGRVNSKEWKSILAPGTWGWKSRKGLVCLVLFGWRV